MHTVKQYQKKNVKHKTSFYLAYEQIKKFVKKIYKREMK